MVIVEVPPERRHPRESPSHSFLESLNLRQGGARNRRQCHVALRQVNGRAVEGIRQERAARTTFLPSRTKHEVIHDQLAPAVKEIGQCLLPLRPVKDIILIPPLPRQLAPPSA